MKGSLNSTFVNYKNGIKAALEPSFFPFFIPIISLNNYHD
ncbi:hypothetical protein N824_06905 [Pedobacter sp. V48]|nr:hypothetical protein N824_06905 [Pedobacter sp. V48]